MLQQRIAQAAAARAVACDGYNDYSRPIICAFQAQMEREPRCDYRALRLTLLKARDPNFAISVESLRRVYTLARSMPGAEGAWLAWYE